MTIEAAQLISDLNTSFPRGTDLIKEGDDHIRMVKATLKNTFPRINSTVTISSDKLNAIDSSLAVDNGGMTISTPVTFNQNVKAHNVIVDTGGTLSLKSPASDQELNFSVPSSDTSKVIVNRTSGMKAIDWNSTNFIKVNNANILGNLDFRGNGNMPFYNNSYTSGSGSNQQRNTPIYHANNGADNNNQRCEGLFTDNGSNLQRHTIITNGANQAYLTFSDAGRLDVNGPNDNNSGVFTSGQMVAAKGITCGNGFLGTDGNVRGSVYSAFGGSSYVNQAISWAHQDAVNQATNLANDRVYNIRIANRRGWTNSGGGYDGYNTSVVTGVGDFGANDGSGTCGDLQFQRPNFNGGWVNVAYQ